MNPPTTHAPWPTATVSTAIGVITLTVTDADHIHAHLAATDSSVSVRGVDYRFGLHVFRDGSTWRHRTYNDLIVTRADGTLREASDAARRSVAEAVEDAVNEWAAQNLAIFRAAVRANMHNREVALRRDVAMLEVDLADKRADLAAVVRERRAHDVQTSLVSGL